MSEPIENAPQVSRTGIRQTWRNWRIGRKLAVGFGILVVITLIVVGWSFFGSAEATEKIKITEDLRVPTALNAASAQANLLRMLASTRGYLALGDQKYRDDYAQAEQDFVADLAKLKERSAELNDENRRHLQDLETLYQAWKPLPNELFDLRDDQLRREPALRILLEDASDSYSDVLRDINGLIEIQAKLASASDEISPDDIDLLKDMVNFQFSFAQMISGLRGYVTTRRESFKSEYEIQFRRNEAAWERLTRKRDQMPPAQQLIFDSIVVGRATFLAFVPQIFAILEDPAGGWRVDLYAFRDEAVPLTTDMLDLLDEMTDDQQTFLQEDLRQGRNDLTTARIITLVGGVLAVLLGIILAYIFHLNIAGGVVRLTGVAEQIREGDLEAQAEVRSEDEIGILARTFNAMTGRLRETLEDVRHEKQRADDLLDVVIPIGVELASEKDFNRLLEKMLLEAKAFCHADAGILLLKTEDDRLEYVIVRNSSLDIAMGGTSENEVTFSKLQAPLPLEDVDGHPDQNTIATRVALTGKSLNVSNVDQMKTLDLSDTGIFGKGYRSISHLAVPLKNSKDEVIGVMELINSEDPDSGEIVPFDENLQQMMESFSMLAVAALEAYIREQQLRQEIKQLRVEIDQAKREREVQQIVDDDSFKTIRARAQELRRRRRDKSEDND